jgi:biotin-(acetyl-CoA carboxylase) ligase
VISIEVEMSQAQLLRAVEQLSGPELEVFLNQALALRARHENPCLSSQESELMLQISQAILPDMQSRFDELVAKRQELTLTEAEQVELLQLTDRIEQQDAQRVEALGRLGLLRGRSLPEIMQDLGITPPACV